jgi:predicted transcriptional regulator
MPTLHDTIRARRESLGITQTEAACRADMAQPHWARLESGGVPAPRLDTLNRVARALECPVAELLR